MGFVFFFWLYILCHRTSAAHARPDPPSALPSFAPWENLCVLLCALAVRCAVLLAGLLCWLAVLAFCLQALFLAHRGLLASDSMHYGVWCALCSVHQLVPAGTPTRCSNTCITLLLHSAHACSVVCRHLSHHYICDMALSSGLHGSRATAMCALQSYTTTHAAMHACWHCHHTSTHVLLPTPAGEGTRLQGLSQDSRQY